MTPPICIADLPVLKHTTATTCALTVAGARRAATLAANIASLAMQWATLQQKGLEAAADAMEAAERARVMAECAASATQESTVRALAADAWDAAQRAIAADRRVTLAIAS
jgi:hypothetical protein